MPSKIQQRYAELLAGAGTDYAPLLDRDTPLISVGAATCGRSAGALKVLEEIRISLEQHGMAAHVVETGCNGHCYAEPVVIVSKPGWPRLFYHRVTPDMASLIVRDFIAGDEPRLEWALGADEENDMLPSVRDTPRFAGETRRLLSRCGVIDPLNINHYVATGGYAGLANALEKTPEAIIEEITRSGLRGLGGAGFSTGKKWELARAAEGDAKYVVCNADEGDPGAFMDRTLIESDPQALIEGMAIAGYAIGSQTGIVYIRNEYPLALETLETAVRQAREDGLLGGNILGSGFGFDIQIIQGAGAFVCGEETALIHSLEGKRGMPRHRPPFPVNSGYRGMPTLVNNVKTLSYTALIMANGAEKFADIGVGKSRGTAIFALAGKIRNTGIVEVPMGTTLREIIYGIGGGVPPLVKPSQIAGEAPISEKREFKAVQIGGPSGGCLPESLLDTPVEFDSLRSAGAIMGSGGMVVMDEDNCMVSAARFFLEFTQGESCGKCSFCRIGTKQMLIILERITRGEGRVEDLELLEELAENVGRGSLCNLGKTAPNPTLTTLRYFRDEYLAHINASACAAMECKELMTYYIKLDKCQRACDACVGSCPTEAIYTRKDRLKAIDQSKCVKCHSCVIACPAKYDAVIRISPISDVPESKPEDIPGGDEKE